MAAPKSNIPPGSVFGFLTVIETLAGRKRPTGIPPRMLCRCVCGSVSELPIREVKIGAKQSCGCRPNVYQRTCQHCGSAFEKLGKAGAFFCSLACRFWSKVDATGGPDACWPWKPAKAASKRIYGSFMASKVGGKAKYVDAHRFAWELANGPVPKGLNVCHSCDNPICCNTRHHFLGTDTDNMQDMVAKGRDRYGPRPSGRYRRA